MYYLPTGYEDTKDSYKWRVVHNKMDLKTTEFSTLSESGTWGWWLNDERAND